MNNQSWILAVVLGLSLAACGPEERENNVQTFPDTDVAETDMGDTGTVEDMNSPPDAALDMDAADTGEDVGPDMPLTDCGADTCGPGEECINEVCVVVSSCDSAIDLGMLVPGTPQTVSGSLASEGIPDLVATCVGDTSLKDRVVTFELAAQATVDYAVDWSGQFDGVVEFRTTCADAGSATFCNDNENQRLSLPAGRHFMVLDQKFGNAGDFTVTLSAEGDLCTPGMNVCNGEEVTTCPDAQSPMTLQCAANCVGTSCQGDACSAAIPVAGTGGTYAGDGAAYTSTLNFAANTNCTDLGAPNDTIPTPGYEVVFYVPGLQAGDILSIDAETNDTNINSVFIMQTCGAASSCSAAFKLSEQPDWVVDAAGDYYVVIDKRSVSNNPFQYSITVF